MVQVASDGSAVRTRVVASFKLVSYAQAYTMAASYLMPNCTLTLILAIIRATCNRSIAPHSRQSIDYRASIAPFRGAILAR